MATFSLKKEEKKTGKGKVVTWNKSDDFMVVEINGTKKVVHKVLGDKLIAAKKAVKSEGEIVDNNKLHAEKLENQNKTKK